jgi:hypothetical protein
MKVYSFRFNIIENVTKVSSTIGKSFDSMSGKAAAFTARLQNMPNPLAKFKPVLGETAKAFAGFFAVDQIRKFGGEVVNTLSEFRKYGAILTNTFGSESDSKRVLEDITKFASRTPFQVNELTESFVKLANRGFVPTQKEMEKIGDIAANQGKSFDQFTEALLDAETGQFERLKAFGIQANKEGDKVTLKWKGITKEVKNAPEAIREGLLALSEAPGVAGSMAAMSKEVGGLISNLGDAQMQLKLRIGEAIEPILKTALPKAIEMVTRLTGWVQRNQELIQRWIPPILKVVAALGALVAIGAALSVLSTIFGLIGTAIAALFSPVTLIVAAVATAVYLIIRNWESVKEWFSKFKQWLWVLSPFGWVMKLIDVTFPQFGKAIRETFGKAFKWIYEKFIEPISKWFGKLFKAFKMEADLEVNKPDEADDDMYSRLNKRLGGAGSSAASSAEASGGSGRTPQEGRITGAGPGKNVTINIQKLVESLNIYTTPQTDLRGKIRQEVTRALIDAVNEVNYAN